MRTIFNVRFKAPPHATFEAVAVTELGDGWYRLLDSDTGSGPAIHEDLLDIVSSYVDFGPDSKSHVALNYVFEEYGNNA